MGFSWPANVRLDSSKGRGSELDTEPPRLLGADFSDDVPLPDRPFCKQKIINLNGQDQFLTDKHSNLKSRSIRIKQSFRVVSVERRFLAAFASVTILTSHGWLLKPEIFGCRAWWLK